MARLAPAPVLRDVPRLDGARIAVVLEHKFIPEEIAAYLACFPLLGADIELVARIWWGDYKPASDIFYADVDPTDGKPWETPDSVEVRRDISTTAAANYDAVIMAANYTSVRLRYPGDLPPSGTAFDAYAHVQSAPLVQFFAAAMPNRHIVKGALCHGLWIFTPNPRLLRGRKVICHSVVMADILNCGAEITITRDRVVTDGDLVTGFSKHETVPFIAAIARAVTANRSKGSTP